MTVCADAADHTKDTLATVKKNISAEKAVLVDVREKSEWKRGHITGAVPLPLSELSQGIDAESLAKRLPKQRIVYTHCAAGVRSCTAADLIVKFGYDVRPLKPGYKDLLEAGFEKAKQ
jgi:rhodanese-related sulfurtransferase